MPASDGPIYSIRVQGQVDESWSEWLGGLTITSKFDGDTLLTGHIIDQAALHGILDKLNAMNLIILSVVQVRSSQKTNEEDMSS